MFRPISTDIQWIECWWRWYCTPAPPPPPPMEVLHHSNLSSFMATHKTCSVAIIRMSVFITAIPTTPPPPMLMTSYTMNMMRKGDKRGATNPNLRWRQRAQWIWWGRETSEAQQTPTYVDDKGHNEHDESQLQPGVLDGRHDEDAHLHSQDSQLLYYLIREIKHVAEHIPHHSRQWHTLHILKLKEQLLKAQVIY